jgi:uncharacterized membrane protein YdbT with pleckstrin-like domain
MNFTLQEGEEILIDTKPSSAVIWYWLLGKMGLLILLLFVLVLSSIHANFLSIFNFFNIDSSFSSYLTDALVIVIFLVIIGGGYLWFWLVANGYHYVVTNQRVIIRYGFILLNQRMIPLAQINDVNMQSTLVERFFGLGSVYIDTLATLLGSGSLIANAFSGVSSRRSLMNNTSRLEGLSSAQCDEIMGIISAHIQKLKN